MEGQKPSSVRSRKTSKKTPAGEDSSDSARSRSWSAGRSASRQEALTRNSAKTESKWSKSKPKKTNRISSSEDEDFTGSVSKRVKDRRLRKEIQANSAQTSQQGKLGPVDQLDHRGPPLGDPTPNDFPNKGDAFDPDLDNPDFNLPEVNTECEAYKRWQELQAQTSQSQAGRGVYLPVVSVVTTPSKNPGLVRTYSEGELKLPPVYDELRTYIETPSQIARKFSGKKFSNLTGDSSISTSASTTTNAVGSSGVDTEAGTALDFNRAPLDRAFNRQEKSKPYKIPKKTTSPDKTAPASAVDAQLSSIEAKVSAVVSGHGGEKTEEVDQKLAHKATVDVTGANLGGGEGVEVQPDNASGAVSPDNGQAEGENELDYEPDEDKTQELLGNESHSYNQQNARSAAEIAAETGHISFLHNHNNTDSSAVNKTVSPQQTLALMERGIFTQPTTNHVSDLDSNPSIKGDDDPVVEASTKILGDDYESASDDDDEIKKRDDPSHWEEIEAKKEDEGEDDEREKESSTADPNGPQPHQQQQQVEPAPPPAAEPKAQTSSFHTPKSLLPYPPQPPTNSWASEAGGASGTAPQIPVIPLPTPLSNLTHNQQPYQPTSFLLHTAHPTCVRGHGGGWPPAVACRSCHRVP